MIDSNDERAAAIQITEEINMESPRRDAESFRTTTESRLAALEGPTNATPKDATDTEGNSLAGTVRTLDARMLQVETLQAENTSNILRLSDLVQTQLAGAIARIAALENERKPA